MTGPVEDGAGPSAPMATEEELLNSGDLDAAFKAFLGEMKGVDRDNEVERILRAFRLNPYEQLGVRFDATDDEIKKAYRKKSLMVHPDKCKHAHAKEAFEVLGYANRLLTGAAPPGPSLSACAASPQHPLTPPPEVRRRLRPAAKAAGRPGVVEVESLVVPAGLRRSLVPEVPLAEPQSGSDHRLTGSEPPLRRLPLGRLGYELSRPRPAGLGLTGRGMDGVRRRRDSAKGRRGGTTRRDGAEGRRGGTARRHGMDGVDSLLAS